MSLWTSIMLTWIKLIPWYFISFRCDLLCHIVLVWTEVLICSFLGLVLCTWLSVFPFYLSWPHWYIPMSGIVLHLSFVYWIFIFSETFILAELSKTAEFTKLLYRLFFPIQWMMLSLNLEWILWETLDSWRRLLQNGWIS